MAMLADVRKWRAALLETGFTAMVAAVILRSVSAIGSPVAPDGPPFDVPLPPELSPFPQDLVTSVESNVNNAFVTSMSREEFSVLNPDDIVAGAGTLDMLPAAELRVSGSDKEHGMYALRNAYLPESQNRDYMRTIFIREPHGTILDFLPGGASRCPARNYGIRARVTDVKSEDEVIVVQYQQYDTANHIFVDEVGEAKVMRNNFIRVALGLDTVGAGSLVTFMCKDYGDPVFVYVGWPSHFPVFRMDEEWTLPVKVVRMTTLKTAEGYTTVVAVLQHPGPPSDKVVDSFTQAPVDGPFMYVGRAEGASRAYGAFSEMMEGNLCSLTAFYGNRRPELHCNVDDVHFPETHLKKAGTARKVKLSTAILASALFALGAAMFFGKMRKAALLPGSLAVGSAGAAIGAKVWENKENAKVMEMIKPKPAVDHEHLVFIQADTLPAPGEKENESRKLKLLLDLAEQKRREEEQQRAGEVEQSRLENEAAEPPAKEWDDDADDKGGAELS